MCSRCSMRESSETLFSAPRVWVSLYKICIDMFPPFGRLRIFQTSVPAEENQQKRPFVINPNQPCQIIQNQHARFFQHTEAPRVEGAARIPTNCASARHLADLASASSVFSHKGLTVGAGGMPMISCHRCFRTKLIKLLGG